MIDESANHPILLFYSRGIGEMKKGTAEIPPGSGKIVNIPGGRLDDPRSWRYQAAIHDYPLNDSTLAGRRRNPPGFFDGDPFAIDGEPMEADRARFWRACQHNSWFFLPWHRMYLHFFEKIMLSHVIRLGGPADWALPYWNYSAPPQTNMLVPLPFRNPAAFPGETNHLFVPERTGPVPALDPARGANAGGQFMTPDFVDLNDLRTSKAFRDVFGGPPVLNHPGNVGGPGALEQTPHNNVHSSLGGLTTRGFMLGFSTAPLDPLFWMHHCNIDRLWEVWVQRQKRLKDRSRNPNPVVADGSLAQTWLNQGFDFHDANGNIVSPQMQVKAVLNTRLPPLSYEYEDTNDPFKGAA